MELPKPASSCPRGVLMPRCLRPGLQLGSGWSLVPNCTGPTWTNGGVPSVRAVRYHERWSVPNRQLSLHRWTDGLPMLFSRQWIPRPLGVSQLQLGWFPCWSLAYDASTLGEVDLQAVNGSVYDSFTSRRLWNGYGPGRYLCSQPESPGLPLFTRCVLWIVVYTGY